MTYSADERLDRAIYGLFEQQIPIRKIKKMLHVGQDRISAVIVHFEKRAPICHTQGSKDTIPPGAVHIIDALTFGDASMSAARIKEELWTRYEIRLGATKSNDLRKFLEFEFRLPKHI
jgi:hypothetical protein